MPDLPIKQAETLGGLKFLLKSGLNTAIFNGTASTGSAFAGKPAQAERPDEDSARPHPV
jgi:hypothetical protein